MDQVKPNKTTGRAPDPHAHKIRLQQIRFKHLPHPSVPRRPRHSRHTSPYETDHINRRKLPAPTMLLVICQTQFFASTSLLHKHAHSIVRGGRAGSNLTPNQVHTVPYCAAPYGRRWWILFWLICNETTRLHTEGS